MLKIKEGRKPRPPKQKRKNQEENRMAAKAGITKKERQALDKMFQEKGYVDYKWIVH